MTENVQINFEQLAHVWAQIPKTAQLLVISELRIKYHQTRKYSDWADAFESAADFLEATSNFLNPKPSNDNNFFQGDFL